VYVLSGPLMLPDVLPEGKKEVKYKVCKGEVTFQTQFLNSVWFIMLLSHKQCYVYMYA